MFLRALVGCPAPVPAFSERRINVDYSRFAGLEPRDANASYGLYPQYRGRGLASSALFRVRDFMISKGVKRAVIRVEPENIDSIRFAERCGYMHTGKVTNDAGIEHLVFVDNLPRDSGLSIESV